MTFLLNADSIWLTCDCYFIGKVRGWGTIKIGLTETFIQIYLTVVVYWQIAWQSSIMHVNFGWKITAATPNGKQSQADIVSLKDDLCWRG